MFFSQQLLLEMTQQLITSDQTWLASRQRWNSRVQDRSLDIRQNLLRGRRLGQRFFSILRDQAQIESAQSEKRVEFGTKVRAWHRHAALPTTDRKSVRTHLLRDIILRPALMDARLFQLLIWKNSGRLSHGQGSLSLLPTPVLRLAANKSVLFWMILFRYLHDSTPGILFATGLLSVLRKTLCCSLSAECQTAVSASLWMQQACEDFQAFGRE